MYCTGGRGSEQTWLVSEEDIFTSFQAKLDNNERGLIVSNINNQGTIKFRHTVLIQRGQQ
jgi:hypothetical protein